jgi:hypothetical protein
VDKKVQVVVLIAAVAVIITAGVLYVVKTEMGPQRSISSPDTPLPQASGTPGAGGQPAAPQEGFESSPGAVVNTGKGR